MRKKRNCVKNLECFKDQEELNSSMPPTELTRRAMYDRVWSKPMTYLEHAIEAEGIAEKLEERGLFPETDPLVDPAEDLIEE
jgi:hypothetical protein